MAGGVDRRVYALRAGDGGRLWAFPTGGPVTSGIAVAGGIVYVGSYDANIYALRARDGHRLWAFSSAGLMESGIVVAGRTVYAAASGNVYALGA